jgi:uncharacterized protein (TIGR02328 family)
MLRKGFGMRLWHYKLVGFLPSQQLLGQHRKCCALRGKGWNKKHSTVDYVFTYSRLKLFYYHLLVISEMTRRGYKVNKNWLAYSYRGRKLGFCDVLFFPLKYSLEDSFVKDIRYVYEGAFAYVEHDDAYYNVCIQNLLKKGIELPVLAA